MAAGLFTISEVRQGDGWSSEREAFVWSADPAMPTAAGGGRAAPIAPWTFGGSLRHIRTDYPGAKSPTVQVMGAKHASFQIQGAFDDRYNFAGYAESEMRRIEELCKRGSLCRVQFQGQSFYGMFVEWSFPYRRQWQIGYQLTFDVHERPEDRNTQAVPPEMPSPATALDSVDVAYGAAFEAMDVAPRMAIEGDLTDQAEASLAAMATAVDELSQSIDGGADLSSPDDPVRGFNRLAIQFGQARSAAYEGIVQLALVRSDTDLAVQTAKSVLDFEDWSRSMRRWYRSVMIAARRGEITCLERAEPNALRLYRPRQGESLYAISRKFYGTPWGWRLIYETNRLTSVTLTGDEVLSIPERGV